MYVPSDFNTMPHVKKEVHSTMMFYFLEETHTLASALRVALEEDCTSDFDIVACTIRHPLDQHMVVHSPSEDFLRKSLLLK